MNYGEEKVSRDVILMRREPRFGHSGNKGQWTMETLKKTNGTDKTWGSVECVRMRDKEWSSGPRFLL